MSNDPEHFFKKYDQEQNTGTAADHIKTLPCIKPV